MFLILVNVFSNISQNYFKFVKQPKSVVTAETVT